MTNRKVRIAIVDDDPRLLNALRINFKAPVSYTHLTLPTICSV